MFSEGGRWRLSLLSSLNLVHTTDTMVCGPIQHYYVDHVLLKVEASQPNKPSLCHLGSGQRESSVTSLPMTGASGNPFPEAHMVILNTRDSLRITFLFSIQAGVGLICPGAMGSGLIFRQLCGLSGTLGLLG